MDDFYQVTTPPADLPISLEEAKSFCKIDGSDDDNIVKALLSAVTEQGEKFTNRCFVTRTITGSFSNAQVTRCERFPFLALRRAPLVAIASFKITVDDALTDVDSDNYQEKNTSSFARILIIGSLTFDDVPYPLQVEFTAGYGLAKDVPEDIKDGLKMHLAFLYENRGDVMPEGKIPMPLEVKAIYGKYRILDTF